MRILGALALACAAAAAQHEYDPGRDAVRDVDDAVAEAAQAHKRVLVEVGGRWCIWCHIMDRFFDENPDMTALRDRNYVTVKVNFSPESKNEKLLSRYPKIPGYPHLFVLDSDGRLLHSQDTSILEQGKGYNKERFRAFLERWAPGRRG